MKRQVVNFFRCLNEKMPKNSFKINSKIILKKSLQTISYRYIILFVRSRDIRNDIIWRISSAGRASALQAEGRRFEPVILHHIYSYIMLG
jgi:hypothetical protein